MNTAFEIAKRMSFQKSKSNTSFIVKLSIAATSISIAAIILTLSIVNGFQEQIAQKVYQFWGTVRINAINGNLLNESPQLVNAIQQLPEIKQVEPYATQTAVIAYQKEMEGIIVKGINKGQAIPFLHMSSNLNQLFIEKSNETVLSQEIANKIGATIGSVVRVNFLQNGKVQERRFLVKGIYHSGIEEYDAEFIYIDLGVLQFLNSGSREISGYSIHINENSDLPNLIQKIQSLCPPNTVATSIEEDYPQIFDWIGVQTVNRNVAVTIMLIIAVVNLLTCLFILILERVHMIGTLSAMGANEQFIRKVFLYQVSFINWMGIAIGSVIGIGLSLLQYYTGWIQLDETAYFMKTLPIKMVPLQIIMVIIGTLIISYISFLIPTIWINKISPAKTIRFD
ncbi:MAG: ABC transporter permease [Chitinophagaceae bacterium]|nr:ABC transporter permease [Sediminibacterium sp.]